MEPSVCIVGGCGHIGLPLGIALAEVGVHVTLLDIDQARVHRVAAGRMPFLERGADELLPSVIATGRLQATTSVDVIRDHDTVVVTIGTPVDEFMDPGVRSFDRSIDRVLDEMRDGQLLILRSTVFPGVTIGILVTIEQRMDRRKRKVVFLGVSLYLHDNFQTMKPNGVSDMGESRNDALAKLES